MKYLGQTAQKQRIQAIRVKYSYDCIYWDGKQLDILAAEKNLYFELWRPKKLTYTFRDLPIEFLIYFRDPDEANAYHTEEIFDRGYLQEFGFTIDVEALWVRGDAVAKIINEVVLNMYGYHDRRTPEDFDVSDPDSLPNVSESVNIV
jgi:hypothetical protein